MKKKIKMKYPQYLEEFKCIGGSCEDNCCIGWDVDIDKTTFKQYFKTKDPGMKKMFQKNIRNNENYSSADVDYGTVKLKTGKVCPFLDEQNYCVIHSKLGEECLSNVCSAFPRITNRIDGFYEMSLDTACPEAARLILLKKDSLQFVENEDDLGKHILSSDIDTNSEDFNEFPIKYVKEMRALSIKIMQNRNFNLSDRFLILGNFIEALEEELEYNFDGVSEFISNYDINFIDESGFINPMRMSIQVSYLKNLIDDLNVFKHVDSSPFQEYSKELISALNLDESDAINKYSEAYKLGFENYFESFMEENSHIFENYIVNFMYKNLFPFSETESVFDGYIMLLIRFAVMRFYLVGIFLHNKEASVDNVIRFMQVFSKTIEHHKTFLVRVLKEIKKNEFDNMEFMKNFL